MRFPHLLVVALSLVLCSCNFEFKRPLDLTPDLAIEYFKNLSPEDGACFYSDLRGRYDFLDSIYVNDVVPALEEVS